MTLRDKIYFGIRDLISNFGLVEENTNGKVEYYNLIARFEKNARKPYKRFEDGDAFDLLSDMLQMRAALTDMMTKDYPIQELFKANPILMAQFGRSFAKENGYIKIPPNVYSKIEI